MPIKKCTENGRPGYTVGAAKWCITYDPKSEASRKKAKQQVIKRWYAFAPDEVKKYTESKASEIEENRKKKIYLGEQDDETTTDEENNKKAFGLDEVNESDYSPSVSHMADGDPTPDEADDDEDDTDLEPDEVAGIVHRFGATGDDYTTSLYCRLMEIKAEMEYEAMEKQKKKKQEEGFGGAINDNDDPDDPSDSNDDDDDENTDTDDGSEGNNGDA